MHIQKPSEEVTSFISNISNEVVYTSTVGLVCVCVRERESRQSHTGIHREMFLSIADIYIYHICTHKYMNMYTRSSILHV